jgi:hypothetical protein
MTAAPNDSLLSRRNDDTSMIPHPGASDIFCINAAPAAGGFLLKNFGPLQRIRCYGDEKQGG